MLLLAGPGVLISTFALGTALKVHTKYFLKSDQYRTYQHYFTQIIPLSLLLLCLVMLIMLYIRLGMVNLTGTVRL